VQQTALTAGQKSAGKDNQTESDTASDVQSQIQLNPSPFGVPFRGEPFVPSTVFGQPKLNIGQPNDKYEVEADRVADKVVEKSNADTSKASDTPPPVKTKADVQRQEMGSDSDQKESDLQMMEAPEKEAQIQEKRISESITTGIQLKPIAHTDETEVQKKEEDTQGETEVQAKLDANTDTSEKIQKVAATDEESNDLQKKNEGAAAGGNDVESSLKSSKGKGSAMDDNTRSSMESGFGADFSGVRIHTDSNAVQMNKSLGSQAFANGSDVYFNEGKYNPSSKDGQHLLAHELTHTVQQGASGVQAKLIQANQHEPDNKENSTETNIPSPESLSNASPNETNNPLEEVVPTPENDSEETPTKENDQEEMPEVPADRSSWKSMKLYDIVTQKLQLNYNDVVARFKQENGYHDSFYGWIKKSILEGWSNLSETPPNIHEINVEWKTETDRGVEKSIPYIEAYSYNDAFAHAGRLGLERNTGAPFYWVTKILGIAKKSRYDFSSSAAYQNYLTAKSIIAQKSAIPIEYVQNGFFDDLEMIAGSAGFDALRAKKAWSDRYLSDVLIEIVLRAQQVQYEQNLSDLEKRKKSGVVEDALNHLSPLAPSETFLPTGQINWDFMNWVRNYEEDIATRKKNSLEKKQYNENSGYREANDAYEIPDFIGEEDQKFLTGQVGEVVGDAGVAAKDKFKIKYTPVPRDKDLGAEGYRSFLKINERLFVLRKYEGWYFITTQDGISGWVESQALAFNPPEPKAEIYEVRAGDSLWSIAKKKYNLSDETNKRLYINAIIFANYKANRGGNIRATKIPGTWELKDPYHYNPHLIEGTGIWLPSYELVKKLEEAGLISDGSLISKFWDVLEAAWDIFVAGALFVWEVIKGVAAFISGLIVGILESIWDLISGIFEAAWSIIKGIFNLVIDALTGVLYRKGKDLFDKLMKMTADDWWEILLEIGNAISQAKTSFFSKWNAEGTFDRWYFRGWVIGYIIAEIVVAIFTASGSLWAKWGPKILKLLGETGALIVKTIYRVKSKTKVDDLIPNKKKDLTPDRDKTPDKDKTPEKDKDVDNDAGENAKQLAAAIVMTEAFDSKPNSPSVTYVVNQLNTTPGTKLKGGQKYKFSLLREGHYKIYFNPVVDPDYTPGEKESTPSNIDKTKELAKDVPAKYKKNYMCKEFASDLKKRLVSEKIKGELLEVKTGTGFIESDKFGNIATGGLHQAIKVEDMVFDNLRPNGILYDDWIKDLGGKIFTNPPHAIINHEKF